ncbi:hypothetical protein LXA43DRAFT_1104274 [Ganoderma leucocontextum]|nr:hypothetical protein LXA43DRAFT_1104274 [Ganoderma leucocontextum]
MPKTNKRKGRPAARTPSPEPVVLVPTTQSQASLGSSSPSFLDTRSFAQVAGSPPRPRTPPAPSTTPISPLVLPLAMTAEDEVVADNSIPDEPSIATSSVLAAVRAGKEAAVARHEEGPNGLTIRIPPTLQRASSLPPAPPQPSVSGSEVLWAALDSPVHGPLWAPTPTGERTPGLETPPPEGPVVDVGRDWVVPLSNELTNDGGTDENRPPTPHNRTATKRPWLGSPNMEEQTRRELGQRRRIHQAGQGQTPASASGANPWESQRRTDPHSGGQTGRPDAPFFESTPRRHLQPTYVFAPASATPSIALPFDFTNLPPEQPRDGQTPGTPPPGERWNRGDEMEVDIPDCEYEPDTPYRRRPENADRVLEPRPPGTPRNATPGPSTASRRPPPRVDDDIEDLYDGPPPPGLILPRQRAWYGTLQSPAPGTPDAPRQLPPATPASARPAASARTRPPTPSGSAPRIISRAPTHHRQWPQQPGTPPRPLPQIPEALSPAQERRLVGAALFAPPELLPEVVENADDDGLSATPIPEGGYPTIHRDDPEGPFLGQSRGWMWQMWRDPPGTVVFVQVWNHHYSDNIRQNRLTAERLYNAVHAITGETDFYIVPPERDPGAPAGHDSPFLWAVRNLSPPGGQQVTNRLLWSLADITLLAFTRTVEIPRWLLSLEGFIRADEASITGTVRAVLESPEHRRRLEVMLAANPDYAGANHNDAVRSILSTLRVEVLTLNNGNIVANVYMNSPTRDVRQWRTWVSHLRRLGYGNYTNATATPREIRWCLGCRSVAHPTHLCPFPNLPGWNGPPAGEDGPGQPHHGGVAGAGYGGGRGRGGMRGQQGGNRGSRGGTRRGF